MMKLADKQQGYLAVYGDIRHSRAIEDREGAQRDFLAIVQEVNVRRRHDLVVPFSVSRGDEFQGLLASPRSAMEILDAFDSRSELFTFRYGLGWGSVETAFRNRTTEMDGTCFQRAFSALEQGKKKERWATLLGAPEDGETVLNSMLRQIQVIRDGWTARQRQAVATRRKARTLVAAADGMGIDKSTLSKMLKAAHYAPLLEAERAMAILLRDYLAQPPGGDTS